MEQPRTINFELTRDDFVRIYTDYYQRAYRVNEKTLYPKRHRQANIGLGVSLAALAITLVLYAFDQWHPPQWVVLACLGGAIVSAANLVDDQPKRRRAVEKMIAQVTKSTMFDTHAGPGSVAVGPEGVEYVDITERRTIAWKGVQYVGIHDQFAFVQTSSGSSLYVPVRAFGSQAEAEEWTTLAMKYLTESGHGIERTMVTYLATHDRPCPGCRYNLRGVAKLACPECGRRINPQDIPQAWQAAS